MRKHHHLRPRLEDFGARRVAAPRNGLSMLASSVSAPRRSAEAEARQVGQPRRAFLRSAAALGAAIWLPSAPALLRADEARWATLCGRLVYDGPAPERAKLKVDKDVDCCGKFDIRDESLMVAADGGLKDVFVFCRTPKVEITPVWRDADVPKRVTLDNRDCIFQPHCLTIWYDRQEFYTVNSDPVAQNVAFSPLGDVPANFVLAVGGDATYRFTRRQNFPVPIACNYHPWESAFVLPRDNPYAALTRSDGTFRIEHLPPGVLEFQFWHERPGVLETPDWPKGRLSITLRPGLNDLGTVKLAPALLSRKP